MITEDGKNSKKKYYFLLIPFILILDQITKYLISVNFELHDSFFLIADFLSITLIHNYGAGFGIMQNYRFLLVFVTLLVLIGMGYYIKKEYRTLTKFSLLGLLSIMGGAIGNLIDRIFYGYVVDFIYFSFWPAFNVADITISLGVGLLILDLFFNEKTKTKKGKKRKKV